MPPKRSKKMSLGEFMMKKEEEMVPIHQISHQEVLSQRFDELFVQSQVETIDYTDNHNKVEEKVKMSYMKTQLRMLQQKIDDAIKLNKQLSCEAMELTQKLERSQEMLGERTKQLAEYFQRQASQEHQFYQMVQSCSKHEENLKKKDNVIMKHQGRILDLQEMVTGLNHRLNVAYDDVYEFQSKYERIKIEMQMKIDNATKAPIEKAIRSFDICVSEGRIFQKTRDSFTCPICIDSYCNVLLKCGDGSDRCSGHMLCHKCVVQYRSSVTSPTLEEFDDDEDFVHGHPGVTSLYDMKCPVCQQKVHDIIMMF